MRTKNKFKCLACAHAFESAQLRPPCPNCGSERTFKTGYPRHDTELRKDDYLKRGQ